MTRRTLRVPVLVTSLAVTLTLAGCGERSAIVERRAGDTRPALSTVPHLDIVRVTRTTGSATRAAATSSAPTPAGAAPTSTLSLPSTTPAPTTTLAPAQPLAIVSTLPPPTRAPERPATRPTSPQPVPAPAAPRPVPRPPVAAPVRKPVAKRPARPTTTKPGAAPVAPLVTAAPSPAAPVAAEPSIAVEDLATTTPATTTPATPTPATTTPATTTPATTTPAATTPAAPAPAPAAPTATTPTAPALSDAPVAAPPTADATNTTKAPNATKTKAKKAKTTRTKRKATTSTRTPTSASASTISTRTTAALGAPLTTAGFDGKTIRVGVLTTTTNPVWGQIGKALSAGIEAHFAAVNRRGGIGGRYKVVLVNAETNYDPALTAQQLDATRDSVVAYASILGTPNVEAVEPKLRDYQMVAGAASQEARWANAVNLLPVFNTYQVQAINGISYFLETSGRPDATVCSLSVATSYGDAGAEGVRFAAARMPFKLGPMETAPPTSTSLGAQIGSLKAAGCQAVMLVTTPQQTLAAVLTGAAAGFSPRWIIMGASFSDRIVTPQTGPLFERGAWVVGDGTEWGDPNVPGMALLRNELIASNNRYWTENPDIGLTFGWAQARVMEAALERAVARADLTHSGVLTASREIGPVDIASIGSAIDYSASQRLSNARSSVFAVDGSYRNAIRVIAPQYGSPTATSYRPG